MEYYYIDTNHQQQGPFTPEALRERGIGPETPVWHQGMGESWLPAKDVPELAAVLSSPSWLYCRSCGGSYPAHAQFCPHCGTATQSVAASQQRPMPQRQQTQPVRQQQQPAGTPRSGGNTALVVVLALLAVAAIAFCGWKFYQYHQAKIIMEELVNGTNGNIEEADTTAVWEAVADTTYADDEVAPVDTAAYETTVATESASAAVYTTPSHVRVTGVNVRLRKSPEINNYNIITNSRGLNVHPNKGDVLRCYGEEGDFYLVEYYTDYGDRAYISKQFTRPAD